MPLDTIKEIATRLRAARKASGFKSAKEFALIHKIPLSTYSQHETGKRSLNVELILHYCQLFCIHPYWMMTGLGDPIFGSVEQGKKNLLNKEISLLNKKLMNQSIHKIVDLDLLKKILLSAKPLFRNKLIKLNYHELINYCFDVYNIVSSLTADSIEKETIINLSISSVQQGAGLEVIANLNTKTR